MKWKHVRYAVLALAAGTAGCDGGAAPSGGEATVSLVRSAGTLATAGTELRLASDIGAAGSVDLASVESIEISITRLEAMRVGGEEDGERGWSSFPVGEPVVLDLLHLPHEDADGILLARGELPAGDYRFLRIHFDDAVITFNRDVSIGGGPAARTYLAGEPYALRIPSGAQTGIKVPSASFVVGEGDADIRLVFDVSTSVRNVVATPNFVLMTPVLNARIR